MPRARIALFVLEALPNARVVRRFVADHARDHPGEIVLVGLSDPMRAAAGGVIGQVRRHLVRSGPGILPYLAVNFGLPDILRPGAPLTQGLRGVRAVPEATPLRTLCARAGVPCIAVDDVNGSALQDAVRQAAPDLLVSYHFDQIFAPDTLALGRLGGINVHPSLLPRHRGPAPTIHALGEGGFGVTVHRLAPAIDTGAILAQAAIDQPAAVTATRAAVHLHDAGRQLLDEVLDIVARTGALPEGRTAPILPYRPWPDRALLRDLRRRGLRLTDAADLADALTLNARR